MKENYLAISLSKVDIGERDRMYTVYTREEGLMRISAKGIRRSGARLAPHMEEFVVSHITIARNYGPGTLAGAVTEHAHAHLRTDYDSLTILLRVRDVFIRLVSGQQQEEQIFDLYHAFLDIADMYAQEKSGSISFLADAFLFRLFGELGYVFGLYDCTSCEIPLGEDRHFFSPLQGGVICKICAKNEKYTLVIDPETLKFMRLNASHNLLQITKVITSDAVQKQLHSLTKHTADWIMR